MYTALPETTWPGLKALLAFGRLHDFPGIFVHS